MSHCRVQLHHVLAVLHEVTTESQVMELPGTLVQDPIGVQHKVTVPEQLVVHIVAASAVVAAPPELARATTTRRPARTRTLRIDSSFLVQRPT